MAATELLRDVFNPFSAAKSRGETRQEVEFPNQIRLYARKSPQDLATTEDESSFPKGSWKEGLRTWEGEFQMCLEEPISINTMNVSETFMK